jgi:hypothetical protein
MQVPNLYCIGDANGKLMLAHAASAQGISGKCCVHLFHLCMLATDHYSYYTSKCSSEYSCGANQWEGQHLKSPKHPSCLFHSPWDQYGWLDRGKWEICLVKLRWLVHFLKYRCKCAVLKWIIMHVLVPSKAYNKITTSTLAFSFG